MKSKFQESCRPYLEFSETYMHLHIIIDSSRISSHWSNTWDSSQQIKEKNQFPQVGDKKKGSQND